MLVLHLGESGVGSLRSHSRLPSHRVRLRITILASYIPMTGILVGELHVDLQPSSIDCRGSVYVV